MRRRVLATLIVTVVLASCAAEPEAEPTTVPTTTTTSTTTTTTAPTTTTEPTTTTTTIAVLPGYELIEIEDGDVRMTIPESWVTVDLTQDDWEELLTEGLAALPDAAGILTEEAQLVIATGGLLLAYDLEHQDEDFITNLNILGSERTAADQPAVVESVLADQLVQFGAVAPAVDAVELPIGPAIKASYSFAPETGFTHEAVQYYVFGSETVYIVTFSTEHLIELEFVFETIMSTFDSTK